jgi:hypothetical protein
MSDQNFEELLQSPYSNRRPEGDEEMPWKLPVAAAIVGALLTATFIVYSIATAPDDLLESSATTVVTAQGTPVEATAFPPGYVEVANGVAMHVEVMQTDSLSTTLFVSSVVEGGAESSSTSPIDVARWTVRSTGTEPTIKYQHSSRTALGGITIALSPVFDSANAVVIGTLPGAIEEAEDVLTLAPEVPVVVSDHRIKVGDAVVVIDEMAIGNGYGSIQWHLEGGLAAKVDAVVTFDGVEFPLSLVTPYSDSTEFPRDDRHLSPPWNPAGGTSLVRVGEPLSGANSPTGITVTFNVSVVADAGESFEIPVGVADQE